MLQVGKWYRLSFPGTFAKVVEYSANVTPHSWLVESLILRSRWWVTSEGRPNNHMSPWLIVPRC